MQTLPSLQQAPAHGLGLHTVPGPLKISWHVLETATVQSMNDDRQHAPIIAVQGAAGQVVPSPR